MLQQIRDRITGKFALAILALIALPFVFFGINYNFIGLGYAAKVNGEEISVTRFENAYRDQLFALTEQGTEIPEEFRQLVREGVLNQMIQEELVNQYIEEAGYRVSDDTVAQAIQMEPTWQVDGQFSRQAYYDWLELRAIDAGAFEDSQRRSLEQSQLRRGVSATAFVTPLEYRRYLNLIGEERNIALAEIDLAELTASIEIDDAEIQAYYDERPDEFQSPESVDVAYIELARDKIAEDIEVSDEEVEQLYQASSSRYLRDEQRQARHILIPFGDDEEAAREQVAALTARVEAGEPFEDLAQQYSEDSSTAERGGDLGLLLQSQLPPGLGDAIFAMDEGEVQGPVRTDFGFHVVRLDQVTAGGALPLADVRNELERELRLEKAEARYQSLERELADALFDASDIEALASAAGLERQLAEGLTRSGGGPFGSNQAAIDAIFDPRILEDREVSDIVELDANRSVVLAVTDYHPTARRPLEEVRDSIVAQLKDQRALDLANERMAVIEAALNEGRSMEEAVDEESDIAVSTATLTRQSADVAPQLRDAVFAEKKPVADEPRIGTIVTNEQKYAVYQLTEVVPGRPEAIPLAERDQAKLQLGQQSGNRDFAALVSNLEANADIARAEDVLSQETLFE